MALATTRDVLDILNHHGPELLQQLGLPIRETQLSMPTDGEPRIKVSVARGATPKVPATVVFRLHQRPIQVPLEVVEDLQHYSPY